MTIITLVLLLCQQSTIQQMTIRPSTPRQDTVISYPKYTFRPRFRYQSDDLQMTTTTTAKPNSDLTGLPSTKSTANTIKTIVGIVAGIATIITFAIACHKNIKKWWMKQAIKYKIKKAVKSDYKQRYSMIPFIPWDETSKVPLDSIFIPLMLKQKRDKKKWEETHDQTNQNIEEVIENLHSDGPVRLIIEANPGCGKSTLCQQILNYWGNGRSFKKYHLVILLKAREFACQESISLAIVNQLPSRFRRENIKVEIENILQHTQMLLLIDGFDELKAKDEQDDLHRLLDNRLYENCDLIITTRPWCLEKLKIKMKDVRYQVVVNISPFDGDDIKAYANKFFEYDNRKAKQQGLVNVGAFYDAATRDNVKQLATEPLTLLFLCLVWQKNEGKQLPQIRTHLYEDLLNVLRIRYNNSGGCEISKPDFDNLLLCLGELAFVKLFAEEGGILVFNEQDVDKYELTSDTVFDIGLLTKADPPQEEPVSEQIYQPLVNLEKFVMFTHLSMQECLAAWYFYKKFKNENENEKKLKKTLQLQPGQFHNFIRFVCGYVSLDKEVKDENLNILNVLIAAVFKTDERLNQEIEFWENTGRNPLYKWVTVDYNSIRHYYDNVSDGNTFCVERARRLNLLSSNEEYLKNKKCKWDDVCLRNISKRLKDTHTLEDVRIDHLKCHCKNRADGLSELIKNNQNIEEISIVFSDITSDIAKSMAPHFSRFSHFRSLILRGNPLRDSICDIFSNLPKTIEVIDINDCGITPDHATSISHSFSKFIQLKSLNLSKNPIEKGAEAIIANLNQSVCELRMSNCGITETVGDSMAHHLSILKTLSRLSLCDLSGNPIGGGAVAVVEHLSNSITLLCMQNCGITQPVAERMAPHLWKLMTLKHLNLGDNPIGHGAVVVADSLCKSIEAIHMNGCGIRTEHVKNMLSHLNCEELFVLSLRANRISEDDTKELTKMVESLYSIQFNI